MIKVGYLEYLAPEETGRTGRNPDARSDLYSLGVLYNPNTFNQSTEMIE